MWSDKSGLYSCTKESVRLPGGGWQWVGDWIVDHHTPGGCDKDGWQYAKDFPASYHPEPSFTDYVRNRVVYGIFRYNSDVMIVCYRKGG